MKTRKIAFLMGMAALAAAAEPSVNEPAHTEGCSVDLEAARPIGILIMAVGRSGSSMVGELFIKTRCASFGTTSINNYSIYSCPHQDKPASNFLM